MKSLSIQVQDLLISLVKDIERFDLELSHALSGLPERVSRLVSSRGLRVVMIDFPEAGALIDKGLSGRLDIESIPHTLGSWERGTLIGYPLFRKLFSQNGNHCSTDPNYVFFIRTMFYMFKKVRLDCPQSAVDKTVNEFVSLQRKLRPPSGNWDSCDEFSSPPVCLTDVLQSDLPLYGDYRYDGGISLLQTVADVLVSRFGELDPLSLVPRHGPGAVADMNSLGDKYLFPTWSSKLEVVFPHAYFTKYTADLDPDVVGHSTDHVQYPARLIAVPKTLKKPRLITCEPIANQYIQQGILKWFRNSLPGALRQCIDFQSQEPSRALAREASLGGQFGTVDLSSASDRLTCWTVERIFRSNPTILKALHACRSHTISVDLNDRHDKEYLNLRMFSGQGSAVTFPVQSIVYSMICIASILYDSGWKPTYKNICRAAGRVRVFGDDIIIPSSNVPSLVHLLDLLELKVNANKSHWSGPFRESCGMDSYRGYDVTPFYLSDLELGKDNVSLVSWLQVSDNAYLKGLWELSSLMWGQVPYKLRKLLPVSNHSLSCLGAFSYSTSFHSELSFIWNDGLQRWEVPALQATVRGTRRARGSNQDLLQFFIEGTNPNDFKSP